MKLLIAENSYIAKKVSELLDSRKLCNGLFNKKNCIISFCNDIAIKDILSKNTITELYIIENYIENYCCVLDRKLKNEKEITSILSINIEYLQKCFEQIHTNEILFNESLKLLTSGVSNNKKVIITKRDNNSENKISLGSTLLQ